MRKYKNLLMINYIFKRIYENNATNTKVKVLTSFIST